MSLTDIEKLRGPIFPFYLTAGHLKGRYIARILAELYPDHKNRMTQTPIFVRLPAEVSACLPARQAQAGIPFRLQLRHCPTIRRQFHHLELEQVDVIVEVNSLEEINFRVRPVRLLESR